METISKLKCVFVLVSSLLKGPASPGLIRHHFLWASYTSDSCPIYQEPDRKTIDNYSTQLAGYSQTSDIKYQSEQEP